MSDDLQMARDLRGAASYLRTHGWLQGRYCVGELAQNPQTPRCMAGAILASGGFEYSHNLITSFLRPFNEALDVNIGLWNDADGRTVEQVLDRLESTALALEIRTLSADKPAVESPAVNKELVSVA